MYVLPFFSYNRCSFALIVKLQPDIQSKSEKKNSVTYRTSL